MYRVGKSRERLKIIELVKSIERHVTLDEYRITEGQARAKNKRKYIHTDTHADTCPLIYKIV